MSGQDTGWRTQNRVQKPANWWLRPRPSTVIQAGDVLIAAGYAEGEADFESLASGTPQETPDEES